MYSQLKHKKRWGISIDTCNSTYMTHPIHSHFRSETMQVVPLSHIMVECPVSTRLYHKTINSLEAKNAKLCREEGT